MHDTLLGEVSGDVEAARNGLRARRDEMRQQVLALLAIVAGLFGAAQVSGTNIGEATGLEPNSPWLLLVVAILLAVLVWPARSVLADFIPGQIRLRVRNWFSGSGADR